MPRKDDSVIAAKKGYSWQPKRALVFARVRLLMEPWHRPFEERLGQTHAFTTSLFEADRGRKQPENYLGDIPCLAKCVLDLKSENRSSAKIVPKEWLGRVAVPLHPFATAKHHLPVLLGRGRVWVLMVPCFHSRELNKVKVIGAVKRLGGVFLLIHEPLHQSDVQETIHRMSNSHVETGCPGFHLSWIVVWRGPGLRYPIRAMPTDNFFGIQPSSSEDVAGHHLDLGKCIVLILEAATKLLHLGQLHHSHGRPVADEPHVGEVRRQGRTRTERRGLGVQHWRRGRNDRAPLFLRVGTVPSRP
mmetsp:Transcript_29672/g.64627  ORF Transcript_29672/g.64627 Transcript_29672/m.64627 type:complete len:302 (-) Transcript_29672:1102-2007(-)